MAVMQIRTNYCVFYGDISDSSCMIKKLKCGVLYIIRKLIKQLSLRFACVLIVEMPVICHTQWNPEVEYSSIFIFVSVTWGYTDTEST